MRTPIAIGVLTALLFGPSAPTAFADDPAPTEPSTPPSTEPPAEDPATDPTTSQPPDTTVPDTTPPTAPESSVPDEPTDTSVPPTTEPQAPALDESVIVQVVPGLAAGDVADLVASVGGVETSSIAPLRMHVIAVASAADAVAVLRADGRVESADRDRDREAEAVPNDPAYGDQWALTQIGWDQAYGTVAPAGSATIAVLDTGVDAVEDLTLVGGYSAIGGDTSDGNGHGTWVASIAAADVDNGVGIAGVGYAGVSVMPVKVLSADGTGQDSDIIAGLVWAADHDADVILMAFSNPGYSQALQDAIDYVWASGAVPVAAAGNDGLASPTYPAGDAKVVGVAATDSTDALWSGSNYGDAAFIAAPGVDIAADGPAGTTTVTGTSAAAAIVAGAAAVLKANDPGAANDVIVGRLARNTDQGGAGNGRLNLSRALADTSVEGVTPTGAPGGGGPIVGPYVIAANNDAHVAPEWAPGNTTVTFNTLYRVTTGGTVQHVKVTLPSGYSGITAGATAFSSGTWGSPTVSGNTVSVALTSGTGLTVGGWARIDITATTPASQSGNAAKWLLQTFTNAAGTAGVQDDEPPVLVNDNTNPTAAITFLDAGGNAIANPVLQNNQAAVVRVRITQTGSGIKYVDIAVPTCFSSPSGITVTNPGGNPYNAPIVTDGFIRLGNGDIAADGTLTATFNATPNCVSGTYFVTTSPSTNATNPPSTDNQAVKIMGGSLTVAAGLANLSITKTDSPDPVARNGTLTYTIGVNNAGPDDASAVKVVDTLPAGTTLVSATGTNWTCNLASGTVTCNRTGGNLVPGAAPNITIVVNAPGTAGSITNSATVSSPNDNTPANNTATATTAVQVADLSITKTDSPDPVATNGGLTYTIDVTNNSGTVAATSVSVSDTLPLGTAFVSASGAGWTCSGTLTVTCNRASIAAGATETFNIVVTAPPIPGTLTNTATVTSPSDNATGNNSATATTTVANQADLSVTKSDGVTSVTAGDGIIRTYTITVSNAGPGNAAAVLLSDTWPTGFTRGTVTPSQGTCTGSPSFTCSLGTINSGANATVTVSYTVPASTTISPQDNSVTVSSTTADPNSANNTATDSNTVATSANLSITKTDDVTNVTAGDGVTYTYTITVSNAGPSDAQGVSFSDSWPGGFTRGTLPAGCTNDGAGPNFTCSLGTIASGASVIKMISYTVPASTTISPQDNSVTVSSTTADPNSANNTATDSNAVTASADLSVTKTDGQASVIAGDGNTYTYTITVSNVGPSTATGVSLSDVWPVGFTRGTVLTSQGSCDTVADPEDFTCTIGAVAPNASVTITATYTVPANTAAGTQTNTAVVSSPTPDPDMADRTASDMTTVIGRADLSITKTGSPSPVTAGNNLTYTITVTNTSTAANGTTATGITVSDSLPANTSFVSVTGNDGFVCTGTGSISCTLASLGVGASATITYVVKVDASFTGASVSNTATVATTGTSDPDPTDDSDTEITPVNQSADISVTKDDGDGPNPPATPTEVVAGENVTYTLSITNGGPSNAQTVVVSDPLPAGTTFVSFTQDTGPAFTCTVPTVGDNGTITCSRPTLAAAASATFTVVVSVDQNAPAGTINNTVTGSTTTGDPTSGNNSATEPTTVIGRADLSITKTGSPSPVTAGNNLTYTITVTNTSTAANGTTATGITVSDSLPANTSFVSVTGHDGFVCSGTGSISCTLASLGVGASATITYVVKVDASFTGASVSNTASVATTGTADPDPTDDSDTETTPVDVSADLSVTKTDGQITVTAGDGVTYTYTIVLANGGPSTATGVELSDDWPASGFTRGALPAGCTNVGAGPDFTCTIGTILPGGSVTVTVTYTVPATTDSGIRTNTVAVDSNSPDPIDTNDSASDMTNVVEDVDVEITKSFADASVTAGAAGTHTFSLLVENLGDSDADNVTISDLAPAGLTFISENSADCDIVAGDLVCSFAHLGPNSSTTIVVTYDVPATTNAATIINTATVTSNEDTDSDSDSVLVVEDVDVEITKSFADASVTAGAAGTHTFSLLVENLGDSDADNVTISDLAPAGLTFISENSADCDIVAGDLVCSFAHLGPNSSTTIVVTYDVPATTNAATIINTATVTSNEDTDSDSDSVLVVEDVDVEITKSFADASVTAGAAGTHTFSLLVENLGDSDADNVTISDLAPAGLTFISENSADCDIVAGDLVCSFAHLGPNSSTTIVVTYDVPATTNAATIINTATVTSNEDTDSDSDSVLVVEDTALTASKTDGKTTVVAGTGGTYTISLRNDGPSDADDVVLDDTIPAPFVAGTPISNLAADCSTSAGNVIHCELNASLAAGATWTVTVTYTVPANATATSVHNTATFATDEIPGGTSASDTTDVVRNADLAITKSDAADPVVAGTNLVYTVTVTNNGPSFSSGFTVSDTLPVDVSFVSFGGAYAADCGHAAGVVTCTHTPDLAVGASISDTITVKVDADVVPGAGAELSNTASVDGDDADPVAANDSDTETTEVVRNADLAITKSDAADPVVAGTNLVYTVTVTNNGPSFSSGFTVSDTLPVDVSFVSFGGAYAADCGHAAGVVTCTHTPDLAVGASISYTITVKVDADVVPGAGAELSNTASVDGDDADPVAANDSDTETTEVVRNADLAITKSDAPDPATSGGTITYTITVTNNGPSFSSGFTVSDTLPVDVSFVSFGGAYAADCGHAAGVVTCTHTPDLAVGASISYTITVKVDADVVPGAGAELSNTASVDGDDADPVAANDSDTETTEVVRNADLAITKSDAPDPATSGGTITYTITVTNNGPSFSSGFTVTDTLNPNLMFVSAPGCTHSGADPSGFGGTVTCVRSTDLAVGASVTYTLVVQVRFPLAPATSISNTATVQGNDTDPGAGNNSDTETTGIVLRPTTGSSTMTNSAFQIQTDLSPWTIGDFEILVNNQNTIVATNPGQFYYHQRVVNDNAGDATASVDFQLNWDSYFAPQTTGGMPIHAYVRLAGSNTWTDWTPQSTLICWNAMQNQCAGGSADGSITVNNVPADAEVWVTAHLDFRCKGQSYGCLNGTDPLKKPVAYSFSSTATVKVAGVPVNESNTNATLLGRGKKVTAVYGTLTDKTDGTALAGVWVRVSQGSTYATAQTGTDGFYIFYDGQLCAGDGLAGCSSGTAWNFANGSNVNTTIRILGDTAVPPGPVAGAAAAYPTGTTGAEVKVNNSWNAKTPPSYDFGVAKGSGYERNWRFSA